MYTSDALRRDLWHWGDAVKHGYWRGHIPHDPAMPRLASVFESRPPCTSGYLDLCRAFAGLHPATRGLADDGALAWFAHVPDVSRQQLGIWLFYVDAWGARKFREDWRAMSPAARSVLLELDERHPGRHIVFEDDPRGDALVAARLRIHRRTVYKDRTAALDRMLDFLNARGDSRRAA